MPSKYWSVFTTGLQNTFVYRWNFLLRSLFGIVPLAGTVFIWRALFESRGEDIRGYSFGQMVYCFLVVLLVDNLVTPTDDEWQIADRRYLSEASMALISAAREDDTGKETSERHELLAG